MQNDDTWNIYLTRNIFERLSFTIFLSLLQWPVYSLSQLHGQEPKLVPTSSSLSHTSTASATEWCNMHSLIYYQTLTLFKWFAAHMQNQGTILEDHSIHIFHRKLNQISLIITSYLFISNYRVSIKMTEYYTWCQSLPISEQTAVKLTYCPHEIQVGKKCD